MAGQLPMMEKEGSETVTKCNRLKLIAEGGSLIKNIYDEGEQARESVVANSATTAEDGKTGAEYD